MISNVKFTKKTALSFASAALLGVVSVFTLQSCGGGGGSSDPVITLVSASGSEGISGSSNLDFTVSLSKTTSKVITLSYVTTDGTAIAAQDYTATSGTLTIPANTSTATISVPVTGDSVLEADETFNLQISNASNGTILNSSLTVVGTILNDDLVGYFTGGAIIKDTNNTDNISVTDLQAIYDGSSIKLMSVAKDLLYDGVITSRTGNDFTAYIYLYKKIGGNPVYTTTASGSFINNDTKITGTFEGVNAGNGEFTLTVDASYSQTASLAKVTRTYADPVSVLTTGLSFSIDSNGAIQPILPGTEDTVFWQCNVKSGVNSKITPIALSNIYSVSLELELCKGIPSAVYTGLATTKITSNADDTLVLIVTDGTYGLSGDFGP